MDIEFNHKLANKPFGIEFLEDVTIAYLDAYGRGSGPIGNSGTLVCSSVCSTACPSQGGEDSSNHCTPD
jgi:hypothetical protein